MYLMKYVTTQFGDNIYNIFAYKRVFRHILQKKDRIHEKESQNDNY